MHTLPTSPPSIQPLGNVSGRPLWSVMIPVYNCGNFLRETLESVLMQAYTMPEMQIEVVDDASTDINVEELVLRIGKGRIKYFRQSSNVGSLRNFETCINRAQGYLVHLLHGDDKVGQGYYQKMQSLFASHPEAGAAFSGYRCIDENGQAIYDKKPEMNHEGVLPNWLLAIGERQRTQYAAVTVRREVYEKLGAFHSTTYGEDWEMWVRVARYYPVAYSPEILSYYRMHFNSISCVKYLTGEYIQDLIKTMQLIQDHLPEDQKKSTIRKSRDYYANYVLEIAKILWQKFHDIYLVTSQVKYALKLNQSPIFYLAILKFYLKLTLKKL